ncbi:hypothetical protein DFH06DRAFT_49708 [Mycena polygramma]|nr:hypothetical protein DFH06DRAFT_49708 [Mycena polygramma]
MSVKERTAMLQQRNAESLAPAVGHAAPLRAKIAQFESRGGVPLPRGLQSFGIGAPPPVDHAQQRRGELYGNRMKPVWVPGAGPPSLATRATRDERQRPRKDIRQEVGMADHLPSPPDSPPLGDPPSPARQSFTAAEEDAVETVDVSEQPQVDYVYDPEIIGEIADEEDEDEEPLHEEDEDGGLLHEEDDDGESLHDEGDGELFPEEDEDGELLHEEDEDGQPPHEDPIQSPFPPPAEVSPPADPEVEQRLPPPPPPAAMQQLPSPPTSVQRPRSPPLLPSPPLSPESPLSRVSIPDAVEPEMNADYGTALLSPPPRNESLAQLQGQAFSSIVHGRVREMPTRRTPERRLPPPSRRISDRKRLPPPPLSPGYAGSSDLTALLASAAALEQRLVAGELPADMLRRLSARPQPVATKAAHAPTSVPAPGAPPLQPSSKDPEHKAKHSFIRNPLSKKRLKKLKEEPDPNAMDESTWFTETTHKSSWRKLASTARQTKSPAVTPLNAAAR